MTAADIARESVAVSLDDQTPSIEVPTGEAALECLARWPADRFYWAILEAPLRRPGPLPPGLMLDLQDHVPLEVGALQAVGIPLEPSKEGGGPRTLVCAVPRAVLGSLSGALTALTPIALPAGLMPAVDVARLNLLVGEFEPRSRRRRRVRTHAASMVGTLLLAGLVSLGLSRRAGALHRETADRTSTGVVNPLSQADLAMLRALAARAASEPAPADVTEPLAAVLRGWPSSTTDHPPAEVQSLSIDSRRIALTVSVDGDPGEFLAAIHAPTGYVMEQPGIGTTSEQKSRLALTFTRSADRVGGARGSKP